MLTVWIRSDFFRGIYCISVPLNLKLVFFRLPQANVILPPKPFSEKVSIFSKHAKSSPNLGTYQNVLHKLVPTQAYLWWICRSNLSEDALNNKIHLKFINLSYDPDCISIEIINIIAEYVVHNDYRARFWQNLFKIAISHSALSILSLSKQHLISKISFFLMVQIYHSVMFFCIAN